MVANHRHKERTFAASARVAMKSPSRSVYYHNGLATQNYQTADKA
tara:strand:+ start:611 stop:745 length:135 start_codon:yes stop_codon:yes gene_type:complete